MNKTLKLIPAFAAAACMLAIGACHKNESRSTSTYNATNDDPARQQPSDKTIADDDWDFATSQGRMVVDPD